MHFISLDCILSKQRNRGQLQTQVIEAWVLIQNLCKEKKQEEEKAKQKGSLHFCSIYSHPQLSPCNRHCSCSLQRISTFKHESNSYLGCQSPINNAPSNRFEMKLREAIMLVIRLFFSMICTSQYSYGILSHLFLEQKELYRVVLFVLQDPQKFCLCNFMFIKAIHICQK